MDILEKANNEEGLYEENCPQQGAGTTRTQEEWVNQFQRDGYVVLEELISQQRCAELLQFIISSFVDTEPDFIIAPDFRMHSPLALNDLTRDSVQQIVEPVYGMLDQFLEGGQSLAELSSITVFPNAAAQNIHPDESNPGKYLVSVFVNLAPTRLESGALLIAPGSHLDQSKAYSVTEAIPVEVPAGSAVFMNSKTWHCGGANQSQDRIRPVFYFSFGDTGLEGPTYSIRRDVKAKALSLCDFNSDHLKHQDCTLASIPKMRPGVDLLCSLFREDRVFVIRDSENVGSFNVEDAWIPAVLRQIGSESQTSTIGAIAVNLRCAPEQVLQVCRQLMEAGVLAMEESVTSPETPVTSSSPGYSTKLAPVPVHQ